MYVRAAIPAVLLAWQSSNVLEEVVPPTTHIVVVAGHMCSSTDHRSIGTCQSDSRRLEKMADSRAPFTVPRDPGSHDASCVPLQSARLPQFDDVYIFVLLRCSDAAPDFGGQFPHVRLLLDYCSE